jgi:tetratricopeptide (TPR) repeat protein
MTYLGAGHYGYKRCPTCGHGMLNGVCYNSEGHVKRTNSGSIKNSGNYNIVKITKEASRVSNNSPNLSKSLESLYKKSIELRDVGKYEESIEKCIEIIMLDPNNYNGWAKMADCLTQLHRNEEAIEACDEAIRADPKQQWVMTYFKRICFERLGMI